VAACRSDPRRERRRTRYEEVVRLHRAGWSITAIAAQVGLSRPTVRKYVAAEGFPGIAPRRTLLRSGSVHATHLRTRWAEGCRDATLLYAELGARGFPGSLRMVQRAVAAWREEPGQVGRRAAAPCACPGSAPLRPRSARQATWLLLRPAAKLTDMERHLRERLLAGPPAIHATVTAFEQPDLVGVPPSESVRTGDQQHSHLTARGSVAQANVHHYVK
jgi:hypothetical protein